MKITFTRPKEVRRQKSGKKFRRVRIFYEASAKIPFEVSVELTKQEMNSPIAQKLINSAMNEIFKMVGERLTKYMKGFESFSEKLYKEGRE